MKKTKYIWMILLLPFMMLACEDYLDPDPDGTLDEKQVFSSPERARGFLNNIYNYIPGGFYGMADAMQACATDEAKSVDLGGDIIRMTNGSMSARSFAESWTWGYYYTGIRKTTIFLENVDEATFVTSQQAAVNPNENARLRQQYKGEAHFLQALFYFELIKRFGGVPILPEVRLDINDDMASYERNTYDECVEHILKNCEIAASLLPDSWDGVYEDNLGRATRAAVFALKSRVLLYAASPLNNPSNDRTKWEEAAAAAKVILDMPEYGLLSKDGSNWNDMLQIWTDPYNKEVLFGTAAGINNNIEVNEFPRGLAFYNAQGGMGRTNPTHDLVKAFQNSDGTDAVWPESWQGSQSAAAMYANKDPRLGYFIYTNGSRQHKNSANPVVTAVDGESGINKDATYTHTGYYLRKFVNTGANIQTGGDAIPKFWVIFRYAEILLNYAEAMNNAYGPTAIPAGYSLSALDALNKVRTRVGMPEFEKNKEVNYQSLEEGIRHERRIELCFEEHRFWDVKRWKIGTEVFNGPIHAIEIIQPARNVTSWREIVVEDRVYTERMDLYPIPWSELLKTKMNQNPGWESPGSGTEE